MVTAPRLTIPSMESVRDVFHALIRDQIADAIEVVTERSPSEDADGNGLDVPLEAPKAYHLGFGRSEDIITEWPTVEILTEAPRQLEGTQQRAGRGAYEAGVEIYWWDTHDNPDTLARILDRAIAALWLIAINEDAYPAWLTTVADSFETSVDDRPGSANARVCGIRFAVRVRL